MSEKQTIKHNNQQHTNTQTSKHKLTQVNSICACEAKKKKIIEMNPPPNFKYPIERIPQKPKQMKEEEISDWEWQSVKSFLKKRSNENLLKIFELKFNFFKSSFKFLDNGF